MPVKEKEDIDIMKQVEESIKGLRETFETETPKPVNPKAPQNMSSGDKDLDKSIKQAFKNWGNKKVDK